MNTAADSRDINFVFAGLVGVILEIIWFLGIGVGLWRGLPVEAEPETAG